jgi:hypothetical protein
MFPFNEYKILRILKTYFTALKNAGSDIDQTFTYLFDSLDMDESERNAFKDVIKNDKIQYMTTYANISTELPTIVCIMDQEIQHSDLLGIGDKLDHDELEGPNGETLYADNYGYISFGVYAINIVSKSILLTRLLGVFVKFILEHYSTNNDDSFYDLEINVDRFSPDADYFPANTFHVHITARFKFIESWPSIESLIHGIFYTACGADIAQYITKPIEAEISFGTKGKIKGKSE